MKSILSVGLVSLSLGAVATPSIDSLFVSQDESGRVAVSYALSEAAIVTLDAAVIDNVEVAASNLTTVAGNVNRYQTAGQKKFWWNPRVDFPGRLFDANAVKFRLSAWATTRPPDYMVVSLVEKGDATKHEFYSSEAALPGGIGSDVYRAEKLVMRYIPAKDVLWTAGWWDGKEHDNMRSSSTQPQRCAPHYVKLTADYYMSVFEMTQGHVRCGFEDTIAVFPDARKPHGSLIFEALRGRSPDNKVWPEWGHNVSNESYIARLRAKTGLDFDLPTAAQAEFACRAGTTTDRYFGTYETTAAVNAEYMWTNANHEVGQLLPNPWGLYDILGNNWEYVLDWYDISWASETDNWRFSEWTQRDMTEHKGGVEKEYPMVDPVGSATGSFTARIVMCGGTKAESYPYFRHQQSPTVKPSTVSVRPVCPVPTF